jgi:hypothetical protein
VWALVEQMHVRGVGRLYAGPVTGAAQVRAACCWREGLGAGGRLFAGGVAAAAPLCCDVAVLRTCAEAHTPPATAPSCAAPGVRAAAPQVGYMAACVLLLDVLHDAWFYWTHRLLHWRPLYRAVHWEHHRCVCVCVCVCVRARVVFGACCGVPWWAACGRVTPHGPRDTPALRPCPSATTPPHHHTTRARARTPGLWRPRPSRATRSTWPRPRSCLPTRCSCAGCCRCTWACTAGTTCSRHSSTKVGRGCVRMGVCVWGGGGGWLCAWVCGG